MSERIGPFALGAAQPQWGNGWYSGRAAVVDDGDDDVPARVLLRASLPGEAQWVALEGARRTLAKHPRLPLMLRRGDGPRTWIAFAPAVAILLDPLLDVPIPAPTALTWTTQLAGALAALESASQPLSLMASPSASQSSPVGAPVARVEAARPSFSEVLVDNAGDVVVVAPPPGTRTMRPGLLKLHPRDRELIAPELLAGDLRAHASAAGAVAVDVFFAGAFLAQLIAPEGIDGARSEDVSSRVDELIRRATAPDPGARHESFAELRAALARASDDYPPDEPGVRKALVQARAAFELAQAERALGS